jgi:hypothetical protein
MRLEEHREDMTLLIRLWDDFSKECRHRGMVPDWKLFMLWVGGVSSSTKRKIMHHQRINGDRTNGNSANHSAPGGSPPARPNDAP